MSNRTALDIALAWIREIEGGYVMDPDDPGGETNYGISKAAYPQLDIAELTWSDAAEIYRRDYWHPSGCDRLPAMAAVAVFDGVVNHGRARNGGWDAVTFLQQAAGVTADGIVGPVTERAVRAADPEALLIRYLGYRAQYYSDLVTADSRLAKFYRGWMHRLFRLQRHILEHREFFRSGGGDGLE